MTNKEKRALVNDLIEECTDDGTFWTDEFTTKMVAAIDAAERRGPPPGYCTVCKTDFGDSPVACDCDDPRYAAGVLAGKVEALETLAADVRNHGWASALYDAEIELARLRAEQEKAR